MKERAIQVIYRRLEITNRAWFGAGIAMNCVALVSLWCLKKTIYFTVTNNMDDASNIGFWIFLSLFAFVAYNFMLIWMSMGWVDRWKIVRVRM